MVVSNETQMGAYLCSFADTTQERPMPNTGRSQHFIKRLSSWYHDRNGRCTLQGHRSVTEQAAYLCRPHTQSHCTHHKDKIAHSFVWVQNIYTSSLARVLHLCEQSSKMLSQVTRWTKHSELARVLHLLLSRRRTINIHIMMAMR